MDRVTLTISGHVDSVPTLTWSSERVARLIGPLTAEWLERLRVIYPERKENELKAEAPVTPHPRRGSKGRGSPCRQPSTPADLSVDVRKVDALRDALARSETATLNWSADPDSNSAFLEMEAAFKAVEVASDEVRLDISEHAE